MTVMFLGKVGQKADGEKNEIRDTSGDEGKEEERQESFNII